MTSPPLYPLVSYLVPVDQVSAQSASPGVGGNAPGGVFALEPDE